MRILLIEDNEADIAFFERTLEKGLPEPFEITCVNSLAEGKHIFSNCDIIVCDLGLPDFVGPETVLNIYSQVPNIPLLVLSGNTDPLAFKPVIEAGAHDYLIKGMISSESLCRCIQSAIIAKNRPGGGATFTFTLPLKTADHIANKTLTPLQNGLESKIITSPNKRKTIDTSALKDKKMLIADDSQESTILYRAFLKGVQACLETVENGKAAVELYKNIRHDIVILDNQMPEMNGLDAASEIRSYEESEKLKPAIIILLTGDAQTNIRIRAEECKIDLFLSKPIGRADFLEAIIGKLLSKKQ